jgi:phosphatidylserine/phosphatidylglycerophosphate/cardiolipin synthase-like enzyme
MEPMERPGSTEHGTSIAERLAFIIDAESYFWAFAEAVERARRSVMILGWDVDSSIRLWRGVERDRPPELAEFLSSVLADRPELEVHILCWDWAMLYALEREPLPRVQLGLATPKRLHFRLDDHHPVGASQHEKIVVIDDAVAFIGGIDLGRRRWDTRAHDPDEPRRVSPAGTSYRPFHDVQAVVSGQAAVRLGERARERWLRATGQQLPAPAAASDSPWPPSVEPALEDAPVRLVLTDPHLDLRETESWHREAIASAQRLVYLENQYLSWHRLGELLEDALERSEALEVAIVTSRESSGWLAQASLDAMREKILERLDPYLEAGRVGAWWPDIGDGRTPTVHTKLTVVDDRMAYLGSANLSNRSMGLDTEAGLVLDSSYDERLSATISALRRSLLAEHLDADSTEQETAEAARGGVVPAVESLRRESGRTLRPLDHHRHPLADLMEPMVNLVDPERPASLDGLVPKVSSGRRGADRGSG